MTTSKLTREGFTESITQNDTEIVLYVVEVYSLAELDQSTASLSDLEIQAAGRAADVQPVPDKSATRHGLTNPRFRVFRNMRSRHQAKVRVTWGARYLTGGGFTTVQSQRSSSRDEPVLQPFLRSKTVTANGLPVSIIELDARKVDRLITRTVYRRLLHNEITPETADALVSANRRKYYTINGQTKILERHDIVPANQTQLYIDTWFYDKSAMPEVPIKAYTGGVIFPVAELPVLGEYIEPIPGNDSQTLVSNPIDLYEEGDPLPWL